MSDEEELANSLSDLSVVDQVKTKHRKELKELEGTYIRTEFTHSMKKHHGIGLNKYGIK